MCHSLCSGFCSEMNRDSFTRLSATAHVERLPAEHILWHDDDAPRVVGVVLDGLLRYERCTSQGRRQILNLIRPGELVGWEKQRRAGYTIETATPVTLCRFDAQLFDRLVSEDRALREAVYMQETTKLDRLRWLTWAIGALSPEERIAAFLVVGTEFMPFTFNGEGAAGRLTVTLNRRDVADLMATTVESICRILKGLEREHLIRLEDPRHIVLSDPAALAERGRVPRAIDRPKTHRVAKESGLGSVVPLRGLKGMTVVNDAAPSIRIA